MNYTRSCCLACKYCALVCTYTCTHRNRRNEIYEAFWISRTPGYLEVFRRSLQFRDRGILLYIPVYKTHNIIYIPCYTICTNAMEKKCCHTLKCTIHRIKTFHFRETASLATQEKPKIKTISFRKRKLWKHVCPRQYIAR
jgi:hypothetical protein